MATTDSNATDNQAEGDSPLAVLEPLMQFTPPLKVAIFKGNGDYSRSISFEDPRIIYCKKFNEWGTDAVAVPVTDDELQSIIEITAAMSDAEATG